jgi:transcriptional regulator with PAS, ATPase and Fis domain
MERALLNHSTVNGNAPEEGPAEVSIAAPRADRIDPIVIDPAMVRLYDLARRVARGTISVLLVGETGTGKEVLAEYIHACSPRAGAPLVRLNCAAWPESLIESELFGHEKGAFTGAARERRGLLESADGGTVFLDEISEVAPAMQAKLLRVLEEGQLLRVGGSTPRTLDVRFIAATNRDLATEVEAGLLRRDLYFRIAGTVLAIPPLRARRGEIGSLAIRFACDAARRLDRSPPQITDAAIDALQHHDWQGNVRELRNVIERAVLIADADTTGTIDTAHLPFAAPSSPVPPRVRASSVTTNLADELAGIERQRILDALEHCSGNQTRAAGLLGMPRRTLIKRLNHYGVRRPRKR